MILKYLNKKYSSLIPLALGDRYYAQDLIRDQRYSQDLVGQLASDVMGTVPRKISGGVVTKGSGDTLNITLGRGWVGFSVEIPDTFSAFPPSKLSADITGVPVAWTAQTNMALPSATLNGSAVNYVKVQYAEADGNTRARARSSGTYSYETVPSFTIVVDTTAPTVYDLVLTTFTGTAGGAFTIADATYSYPYWSTLSTLPVGSSIDFSGTVVPTGWMIEDGASLLRASYPALWSALSANKGTVTMTSANPGVVTLSSHGFITGDCISFTTTGALPTNVVASTNYYVVYINSGTFNLATTYSNALAGTKIDTSAGVQSGVHTLTWNPWGIADSTHFYLPDSQGITTEGSGQLTTNGASWGGANYIGRLGQYKQDTMQSFGYKDVSFGGSASAHNHQTTNGYLSQGPSGSTEVDRDFLYRPHSTNGTPRTGPVTAGPRVGKYKIIKVI